MTGEIERKVALVTGASRNIGRAITVALAARGCNVVVHVARDIASGEETAAAVRALGVSATVVSGDLSDPKTAAQVVNTAAAAYGRLDYLVNNAAIRPESPFESIKFEEWRDVLAVCLDAPFLVSQAALPYLQKSDCAAIVNIGGLTGHTGASHRAHVITAKAGLIGLTKAMAHDLAPLVTVNCVAPGMIATERQAKDGVITNPHHHAKRTNLLGRRGTPEDVAEAVAYLCSPGGRYITGETVHVNGGAYLS
ncbi:SDR family NAD(P)-dependent oxidoreductase [Pseudomonas lopnurensis]|uniref:SDR family NAD(P)-dependent oxidoreductase n=1 Tax=Pseudomonas lopnurensis TaxID=1477517 RepID=UPI0028AC6130|nr:SDR family oxidoreductase [Pseudomonas lopnurensis]